MVGDCCQGVLRLSRLDVKLSIIDDVGRGLSYAYFNESPSRSQASVFSMPDLYILPIVLAPRRTLLRLVRYVPR